MTILYYITYYQVGHQILLTHSVYSLRWMF